MIRLAVRAPAEAAEAVLAALLELAPAGLEQVDGEGWVEYALYGAPGELPAFPEGEAEVAGVRVAVRGEEVADDWAERWRQFHQPVLVGERLWVRPPWAGRRSGALDLVVDPGQAFGTGSHPTTRLCLELMLELEPRGSFADLGCGSGVLSIAAAKLGFEPVTAVDVEPQAIEATERNAAANGVEISAVLADALGGELPDAEVTVANITLEAVGTLGPLLRSARAITSGYLASDAPTLVGYQLRDRREREGWAADLHVRQGAPLS